MLRATIRSRPYSTFVNTPSGSSAQEPTHPTSSGQLRSSDDSKIWSPASATGTVTSVPTAATPSRNASEVAATRLSSAGSFEAATNRAVVGPMPRSSSRTTLMTASTIANPPKTSLPDWWTRKAVTATT